MAVRSRSDSPPLQRNPLKYNSYFDLILFCTWDNVLGPRILRKWSKSDSPVDGDPSFLQDPDDLRLIATYSIDVAEESDTKSDSISEKFFVLGERAIMISTFLVRVESAMHDTKVFALSFVLPASELNEWLNRRNFMENSCKRIISKNLLPNLKEELRHLRSSSSDFSTVLDKFESDGRPDNLQTFALLASHSRYHSLAELPSEGTFVSAESLAHKDEVDFVKKAITAHLISHGHTLVVGSSVDIVNKMIRTLALFSPLKEHMMSLPCFLGQALPFCSDLYLQAMQLGSEVSRVYKLPISLGDFCQSALSANVVAPTVMYMDARKIFRFSSILDYYELVSANSRDCIDDSMVLRLKQPVVLSDNKMFTEVLQSASVIGRLFVELAGFVTVCQIEEDFVDRYVDHFMHLLSRKSLVMAKIVQQHSKQSPSADPLESEALQTALKHSLETKDENDLKIIEGSLGRLDPGFLRKYLPIAAGIEKRRATVMKELGVL